MKLKKFRIQNYKSIKDSGDCWLASDVTILAGKNESGKTATLEALRDFNTDIESISESAFPLDDSEARPTIEMCFEVKDELLDHIFNQISIQNRKVVREYVSKNGLTIEKQHDGTFSLDVQLLTLINKNTSDWIFENLDTINPLLDALYIHPEFVVKGKPELQGSDESIRENLSKFITEAEEVVKGIGEVPRRQKVQSVLADLTTGVDALELKSPSSKFLNEIIKQLPRFIFFSSFESLLPFEIALYEAVENTAVQDFSKVAGLSLEEVKETSDTQRRKNLLSKHSAKITGDFKGFYSQDVIELTVDSDGDKLLFGVKEEGRTEIFKPDQRSKGFQWFLSFYLRVGAEKGDRNIILIDEPGLYLHAKAQQDVLDVLAKHSKESQIMFSTHSTYLIDAQRLDRVRLIQKTKHKGSWIESKIHKVADKETLTPIITAIGLDVSKDLSFPGARNVVLEGPSDYYYLLALKELIDQHQMPDACLIPCMGATKIPQIVSLLIGWGLEYMTVMDNDREGKAVAKELEKKLSLDKSKIAFVSQEKNHCTEDLFSRNDFNKYVLFDNDPKIDSNNILNSKFLKINQLDKVLHAKKFFEQVTGNRSTVRLSSGTRRAFKQLFDDISKGFSLSNS